MVLNNVKMVGTDEAVSIRVTGDKITVVSASVIADESDSLSITFDNALVFPGLINSHDHLDFNLFPQLGNRIYNNYTEWGNYIHKNYKDEIVAVLKIPVVLRSEWGVFKNLLCGVTTVINHGEPSGLHDDLITIFEEAQSLHSVHFEKGWKFKLNNPFKTNIPVNIHVGEGDDWLAFNEINRLIGWNLFKRKLIGVHAVSMTESQAKKFEAVVWCPQSNYFLLNKTAPVNHLKKHARLLFGTDSTLTSTWNIWDHLRLAQKTRLIDDDALYHTLNQNAAKTWGLNCGELKAWKDADLVIAKMKKGTRGFGAFFAIGPSDLLLVIHKGQIRLFDETLLPKLKVVDIDNFSKIFVGGAGKYVQGNLPALMEKIKEYYPKINFPVTTTIS
jgi:cytosine/adenosine deaminase-related metal-dependent hydrolase